MSDATKQRTWRDLLLEDFKDTRNVPAKGDSEERMLARVDAWAACLDQLESQNQALQERAEKAETALRRFGQHQSRCSSLKVYLSNPARIGACDCGLNQLLSPTQETDREMEKQFPDGDSESFR